MLSEKWEDQYRRLHRQYDLLRRTADQNQFEEIHEMNRARDILYHFCCDVFHLKDWIYYADRSDPGAQKCRYRRFSRRETRTHPRWPWRCAPTLPTASNT